VIVTVALAAEVPQVEPPSLLVGEDFRSYLDQARFFLRKEWFDDAREQLEKAVATEDGRLDAEAWFLLASVRYELGDLAGARFAADRALVHSRDDDQARQVNELLQFFEQKFGFVTVDLPYDGVTTRLHVVLESTIFDPELKLWLSRLQHQLADPVLLPYEIGLPAGRYTVNGTAVDVTAGSRQVITPRVRVAASEALHAEVSLGAVGPFGPAFGSATPAPNLEIAAHAPIGPGVVVGLLVDWTPQPYVLFDQTLAVQPAIFAVGARAGFDLPGPGDLAFRPALVTRFGGTGGIELGCHDAPGGWECAQDSEIEELYVYLTGASGSVGLETAALWLDRSRGGFGGGAVIGGDVVFGNLPASSSAVVDGGEELQFDVVGPRGYLGADWRLSLLGVWAF
jgi:hypothetical protein